ncbi:lipopolysaccharide biosynthesis protein (plasmid) [Telmatobacter bradus]|uniref:lipopolysaccharide biosynthesis protein n=1 Tax=Telmatobacter bradus TaxID=474953 RepID=UPI003B439FF5
MEKIDHNPCSDAEKQISPVRSALSSRLKHMMGLDRAIAFTVLARGWSTVSGVVTVLLIARFLSPAEQGYYYTFSSLVALQIVFELGFSFVILQLAAHERAHLKIRDDGTIEGDPVARSRLASIFQKTIRWYTIGALLMAAFLLPVGFHFFLAHRQPGPPVLWQLPWIAAVLATTLTFQMDPLFAFLEGCGRIHQVACMRFTQAFAGSLMAWAAFFMHHGLFAPALVISGQAIAGGCFLFSQRTLLLPLFHLNTSGHVVSWRREIWPFQWRIAISWLCGYFIFQLFNPVLFAYRGAAEAGRMGMSLSIASALSAIAIAWMSTKASPFGMLVARGEHKTLDQLFFRTLWQSSCLLATGIVTLLLSLDIVMQRFPQLAVRVLPLPIFGLLLATVFCNHFVFSEALYLRAHAREPFLLHAITVGILTACSTLILGKLWGAQGVTIGYFCTGGIFGLAFGTYIFITKRRQWHTGHVTEESNTL